MHSGLRRIKDTLDAIETLHKAESALEEHKREVPVDGMANLMQKLIDSLEDATKVL